MATLAMKDCNAVAVDFDKLVQEGALLDRAVSLTTDKLKVLLLGDFAARPPSLKTLDLLAACFISSAKRNPVLDIVPIFPFLQSFHVAIEGCHSLIALDNDEDMRTFVKDVNLWRESKGISQNNHLNLDSVKFEASLTGKIFSEIQTTPARIVGPRSWEGPLQFSLVAVGGTFDRLHAGHRLLLAATALVAIDKVFIGVTSDKLLSDKRNKELLQPYEIRARAAVEYVKSVNPALSVTCGPLVDPKVPPLAATEPGFDAIIVSEETVPGAEKINAVRHSLGFEPLVIVVVGLLSSTSEGQKLSSTELRQLAASASASADTAT